MVQDGVLVVLASQKQALGLPGERTNGRQTGHLPASEASRRHGSPAPQGPGSSWSKARNWGRLRARKQIWSALREPVRRLHNDKDPLTVAMIFRELPAPEAALRYFGSREVRAVFWEM